MAIFNDARAAWIVSVIATALALTGGLITFSAKAGALETRVSALEQSRQTDSARLEDISATVHRIEGQMAKR